MMHRSALTCGVLLVLAAIGASCATTPQPMTEGKAKTSEELFHSSVKPLLESRCSWCHSNDDAKGGLNFQERTAVFSAARPFLVAGSADESLIYQALARPDKHPGVMPGDGWGITAQQKNAVRTWIETGAYWPDDRKGKIRRKPYRVEFDDYL
ncbi:MAG: putative membrane protein [Verrucomicrobiales bacterium]|jgi:uncharacterized membrane protein